MPRRLNVYHIRDFFLHEKNRGISDSTIKVFENVFGSLFEYYTQENVKNNYKKNMYKLNYTNNPLYY